MYLFKPILKYEYYMRKRYAFQELCVPLEIHPSEKFGQSLKCVLTSI